MSRTLLALLGKYLMTLVFAFLTIGLMGQNSTGTILTLALIATAGNYFMGDALVLPAFGSVIAALGDGLLAAAVFYIASVALRTLRVDVRSLFFFGALIAVGEYFFHRYLLSTPEVEP